MRSLRIPATTRATFGLGIAQALFGGTFRGPRDRFWSRMTTTGLTLGSFALLASQDARRVRIGPREVALGLASAGTLYGTFWLGDRFARRFVPTGERDIEEIYQLRSLRPRPEIAARLVSVIAPSEELFWRGLIQSALMERFGRWRGAAMGAAAYGGVHGITGNFTLLGAAGVAGAHWAALYAAGVPLGALIVSHTAWDIWIFLVRPTSAAGSRGERRGRHAST